MQTSKLDSKIFLLYMYSDHGASRMNKNAFRTDISISKINPILLYHCRLLCNVVRCRGLFAAKNIFINP